MKSGILIILTQTTDILRLCNCTPSEVKMYPCTEKRNQNTKCKHGYLTSLFRFCFLQFHAAIRVGCVKSRKYWVEVVGTVRIDSPFNVLDTTQQESVNCLYSSKGLQTFNTFWIFWWEGAFGPQWCTALSNNDSSQVHDLANTAIHRTKLLKDHY